jgi:hypothetical protein
MTSGADVPVDRSGAARGFKAPALFGRGAAAQEHRTLQGPAARSPGGLIAATL